MSVLIFFYYLKRNKYFNSIAVTRLWGLFFNILCTEVCTVLNISNPVKFTKYEYIFQIYKSILNLKPFAKTKILFQYFKLIAKNVC